VNPFRSLRDYETCIYTLPERYASIVTSTLVVAREGASIATVAPAPGLSFERPNLPFLIEEIEGELWRRHAV
jgi:hypothetical protein